MRLVPLLVCCLIACGDDSVRHTPDATSHDGPAADSAPDAPPEPVTLTASIGGVPAGGVKVYFLDADSSVVLATATDSTGTASAVMAAGGSVTAIDPYGGSATNHEVYTFEAVKPGDHLVLNGPTETAGITMTVTAPVDGTAGIVAYEVQTPCGGTTLTSPGSGASPTGQLTLYGCGTTSDLMIVARDDAFQIADYIYVHDAAITDAGTLDLSQMTYTAAGARTFSLTNIPTGFTPQGVTDGVLAANGVYVQSSGNLPADGSATPVATVPMGTHWSQITIGGAAGYGQHYLFDWGPWADAFTTDVGARVMPDLTAFPTFDPSLHAVLLTEATGGATPDFVYASLFADRTSANLSWSWTVAGPHATTLVLPTLPTDVFDANIGSTDSYGINTIVLAKAPGGYDAVRPGILASYGFLQYAPTASGQITAETILAGFRGPRR